MLAGACAGGFLASAILRWLLGLGGTGVAAAIVGAAALGAFFCLGEARQITPMDPAERRDAILGWGALIGGVVAIACLFVPMPWGALAGAAVLATTVIALRRLAGPAPGATTT